MGISAARRWLSRCLPSWCAALGARPSLSSIPQRPQPRRSATRRIMARSPSCAKSGFPSSHIAHVRCVARSMATGITLSIWMLRTPRPTSHLWRRPRRQDYALARLDRAPRRRGRSLVHRQFRCHLPRRARRLHRYARAAVGSPREPRHRHTDRAWISPTLSVQVRSRRRKSTLIISG